MSTTIGDTAGDAAAPAVRRVRIVLALSVLAPFLLAAGLATWRLGDDARAAVAARTVAVTEAAAAAIRAGFADAASTAAPGPGAPDPVGRGIAALEQAGFRAGWYPADRGFELTGRDTPDAPLPVALPVAARTRLASLDRVFDMRINGRTAAVAPVKDADEWDTVGALVVLPPGPEPARLPPAALLAALLAFGFTALATFAFARRPGPAAGSLVFLPALAFTVWLVRAPVPLPAFGMAGIGAAPAGDLTAGAHGFQAILVMAAWAVIAGIALSLARTARTPLRLAEAARAWAFLAPSFVHLLVFSIGPILFALWLSFHEWNLLSTTRPFVGLGNYRELAGDAGFRRAIGNTTIYVLFVPAGMVVALALALLANRRIPGVNLLRTVFFLPYVTSFVAISLIWKWMFQPDVGLLNNLLARIGLPPGTWLSSPATALPSLMLMSIWMYAGYMMVIFLAGLQSIPATLYESARIDGAGPWRRFRHITLPLLRPTLLFILVTMVIFMFQVFTAVYVMTEGGPLHATDVVVYHIYRNAWEYLRMGYASAMAWVLFAIVFLVTLVQFRWLGGRPAQ